MILFRCLEKEWLKSAFRIFAFCFRNSAIIQTVSIRSISPLFPAFANQAMIKKLNTFLKTLSEFVLAKNNK